jgi:toxin ParE1/3/4
MKYRLTRSAQRDIREITRYIRVKQKSPQNALLVAKRLQQQFERLVEMPNLGHVRPELEDDRALVISVAGLVIICDPSLRPLTVLRVIHAARNLGDIDVRD